MREPDTGIGGSAARFPSTRVTAIAALRSDDEHERTRAFDLLLHAYWKPVYKYLRLRWNLGNEEAKDATQEFFARAIDRGFFSGYDPAKGTFRTFLRTVLDRTMSNDRKAGARLKRGGGASPLSLDFELAERELDLASRDVSMEEAFERELARSLFTEAVESLREECRAQGREVQFRVFEAYDLDDSVETSKRTYAALGAEIGIPATTVTNHLSAMRKRFREIVIERLREITASDTELRNEARSLLGIELG